MIYRKKDHTVRNVAIGSTIAAIGGFIAGVLTAPKSGKETRQDIKEGASKGVAEAEKELKKAHTELDKVMKQTKANSGKLNAAAQKELNELLVKAKDSKEKAREVLSAVHEGDAEDQDLDRAVKAANRSIKHLKKYLKK
jgi:gas vesicle protein